MSLESLKLTKQLLNAATEAGYTEAQEIQSKTLSRISGGQDIIAVGPEGIGKTTTLVWGTLMKLKYRQDEPPRALILVPTKEKALALEEQFKLLGKYTDIRTICLYPGVGIEGQKEALAEGTDVVIGTPDRIHDLYLKSGINISKLKLFVLDDSERIIQQGFQTLVHQLSESLPKCQHLIFTEVFHTKLDSLIKPFMNFPVMIEVSAASEVQLETIDLLLYKVPNYKTKLNLLNLLLADAEGYPKIVVFANTRITAESLYKSLNKRIPGEVVILHSKNSYDLSVESVDLFEKSEEFRVLVAASEDGAVNASIIPYLLHFDLPESIELFIERIQKSESDERIQALTFATDIELIQVAKIEKAIGKKIPVEELPLGLIIEGDRQSHKNDTKEIDDSEKGKAFHEKKASNAKDYNYKYKDRLKMFGKKNRRHKRGE